MVEFKSKIPSESLRKSVVETEKVTFSPKEAAGILAYAKMLHERISEEIIREFDHTAFIPKTSFDLTDEFILSEGIHRWSIPEKYIRHALAKQKSSPLSSNFLSYLNLSPGHSHITDILTEQFSSTVITILDQFYPHSNHEVENIDSEFLSQLGKHSPVHIIQQIKTSPNNSGISELIDEENMIDIKSGPIMLSRIDIHYSRENRILLIVPEIRSPKFIVPFEVIKRTLIAKFSSFIEFEKPVYSGFDPVTLK